MSPRLRSIPLAVLICALATAALQWLTHEWSFALLVPFAYGLLVLAGVGRSLMVGLLASGSCWLVAAAWSWGRGADLITERVATMIGVGSPWIVLLATALVGAVAGGLGGAAGGSLRQALTSRGSGGQG